MKKLLAPLALLALFALSCKKKTETIINTPSTTATTLKTYSTIDEVFFELSLKPKVVTFNATDGASFYGNSGTRYIFKKNSLQYANGSVVTGDVQAQVTEYLKKGDMIFSKVLPVSNGRALISGGQVLVEVSKNGQEIFLRPGYTVQIQIPQGKPADTAMQLFRGVKDGTNIASNVNWMPTETDSVLVSIYYNGDTISLFGDSLDYWNADHYVSTTDRQNFNITVNSTGGNIKLASGLACYAVSQNENGLMSVNNGKDGLYNVDYLPSRPISIVSFGLINGHFYGGVIAATPKTGENYTVTLTEVIPADFKAQINALY